MNMNHPNTIQQDKPLFDPENDKLYTTQEVADIFGVSPETIREWIRSGKLPAIRLKTRQMRVKRSDIAAFAAHKYTPGEDVTD